LLELLGDIGGLYDGLKLIGSALVSPIAAFALKTQLFTSLFSYLPSVAQQTRGGAEETKSEAAEEHLKSLVSKKRPILPRSNFLCLCCDKRGRRYKKMLARADKSVQKELDLFNFVEHQR